MNTMIYQILKGISIPNIIALIQCLMHVTMMNGITKHLMIRQLPPLEDDQEKYYSATSKSLSKGGKERGGGQKNLTPNKLLTRILLLLA